MNWYKTSIAVLLVLAVGIVVLTFFPSGRKGSVSNETSAPAEVRSERASSSARTASAKSARPEQPAVQKRRPPAPSAGDRATLAAPSDGVAPASEKKDATARERSVAAWEALVEQLAEQKDVPPAEHAVRVKEAFDQLDKGDQMDGIHRALNLLPDEQFPSLYGILFDKTEDPEVLDAIFSDALNRPEDLKNPLMKELRKDKEHPMFFESARILDVVEPEEAKP